MIYKNKICSYKALGKSAGTIKNSFSMLYVPVDLDFSHMFSIIIDQALIFYTVNELLPFHPNEMVSSKKPSAAKSSETVLVLYIH